MFITVRILVSESMNAIVSLSDEVESVLQAIIKRYDNPEIFSSPLGRSQKRTLGKALRCEAR